MAGGAMDIGNMFSQLGSQIHEDILEGMDAFYSQNMGKKQYQLSRDQFGLAKKQGWLQNMLMAQQIAQNNRDTDWERRFAMALGRR